MCTQHIMFACCSFQIGICRSMLIGVNKQTSICSNLSHDLNKWNTCTCLCSVCSVYIPQCGESDHWAGAGQHHWWICDILPQRGKCCAVCPVCEWPVCLSTFILADKSTLCFRQIHILIQHMGTWSPIGMAVCTISCICSWLLLLHGGKGCIVHKAVYHSCITKYGEIYP